MEQNAMKRYLPWVVATALFMEQLDTTIVNTAVPAMAVSLHVTPLSLKAVVACYTLSLALCIPVSGWLADRFGTRRVFAAAVAVFTLSSMLCGLSVSVPMLVASRVLQGVGGAMMTPVGRLAIIRSFPKSELLVAMNFVILPALIGPLIGYGRRRDYCALALLARDFFRQRSHRYYCADTDSPPHAGLLRRCAAPAGYDRVCPFQRRNSTVFLAAGNFWRA